MQHSSESLHVSSSPSPPVPSSSPLQLCRVLTWEPTANMVEGPMREHVCDDGGGKGGES